MPPSKRQTRDDKGVVRLVTALADAGVDCTVELPWRQLIRVGEEDPFCTLVVKSERLLRRPLTELSLGRAYVDGDLDIDIPDPANDAKRLFKLRDELRSGTTPAQALRLAAEIALVPPTWSNARAIGKHYSLPDEFFFAFLDPEWPLYSQCRWDGPDMSLAAAAQSKLTHAWDRLKPEAGQRILDVGAGWGVLMRYRDEREADVGITALTLTEDSKEYIEKERLDKERDEVLVEDILDHRRCGYYNHVVILGVIEHIPTYARLCRRVWDALEPGGLLYLDASATRDKYAGSAFTRRYTWPGPHSCLDLPGLTRELTDRGFKLISVEECSKDYQRTMQTWARNLDDKHDDIKRRWGEYHYRAQRVFLWGGAAAFESGRLQCYTVVAQKPEEVEDEDADEQKKRRRRTVLRRLARVAGSLH